MRSPISFEDLPRSGGRSAGRPQGETIKVGRATPSSGRSRDLRWEARMAEQWQRALRVLAAEFVCEISGYDVRRYLTEDADLSTSCH